MLTYIAGRSIEGYFSMAKTCVKSHAFSFRCIGTPLKVQSLSQERLGGICDAPVLLSRWYSVSGKQKIFTTQAKARMIAGSQ